MQLANGFTLRTLTDDDFDAAYALVASTFHEPIIDERRKSEHSVFEPERMIGIFDDAQIVASAGAFTREMTLPGGPAPVAHVTWVGVAPTHTRRGLLTAMMRHQLTDLYEEGREPVAALWASEAAIYGRFGYGTAARLLRLVGKTQEVQLDPNLMPNQPKLIMASAAEPSIRERMVAAYEKIRPHRVGYVSRTGQWWDYLLLDPADERHGAFPLRAVVYEGEDGPEGFATFWAKEGETTLEAPGLPDGEIRIGELHAANPVAHAALWSFLLNLDLMRRFVWETAPVDEGVLYSTQNPRAIDARIVDNIWVRVVDFSRAMTLRSYASELDSELDIVFELHDEFCPWNEGRWRLSASAEAVSCERTIAKPDIELSATELGAIYLGGTSLGALAATGRLVEHQPGALAALSAALFTARAPYCPEGF